MKRDTEHRELLIRYLSGNYTDEEKLFVEKWKNESADNRSLFEEYEKIWKFSGSNNAEFSVDVDAGWKDLNKKIEEIERLSIDFTKTRHFSIKKSLYYITRIAAVLVIAFGLYYLIDKTANHDPKQISFVANDMADEPLILNDGSELLLNKGARVEYPESFTTESRQIDFCGEAFFNVAHNPDKPFIIDLGEVQVEVLGTSFNLSASDDCDKIELQLESGKVRFSSVNTEDGSIREQLILLPGQQAVYSKTNGLITKSLIENSNHLAWKTGVLEFEKTPLSEVIITIEKTHGLHVITDNTFENLSITARFDNETPESIFKSIQTIFGIDYEIDGETVLLK